MADPEETAAALVALLDAVNTMTYPRHHPAYGVALRVVEEMPRPLPMECAMPVLMSALRAAIPHLRAAIEPLGKTERLRAEYLSLVIDECERAMYFAENGTERPATAAGAAQ